MRIKCWFTSKDDAVVVLNYCIGDRLWFKILWTEDKWLDNKHLDGGTWWLRKKMSKSPNHKPRVPILATMFSSMLYKQGSKIIIDDTLLS
ncbi:hypothetical protein Sjap_013798 [Stephania japonica]|uniref:Uncharacterized protein n=1 Tax=Stephania japonica TaxID=461633 RepID=A0AAP0P1M9_9MAGN